MAGPTLLEMYHCFRENLERERALLQQHEQSFPQLNILAPFRENLDMTSNPYFDLLSVAESHIAAAVSFQVPEQYPELRVALNTICEHPDHHAIEEIKKRFMSRLDKLLQRYAAKLQEVYNSYQPNLEAVKMIIKERQSLEKRVQSTEAQLSEAQMLLIATSDVHKYISQKGLSMHAFREPKYMPTEIEGGVYILWAGTLDYIGSAADFRQRLVGHHVYDKTIHFLSVIPIANGDQDIAKRDRFCLESELIEKFKPAKNKMFKPGCHLTEEEAEKTPAERAVSLLVL